MSTPLRIGGNRGERDLVLAKPVMPAAGFMGYGRGYPGVLDPQCLGALVTRTTTLGPRTASSSVVRTRCGFILPHPPSNPGLSNVLRQYGPGWAHWAAPVILSVYVDGPEEMAAVGRRLEGEATLAGVELTVPYRAGAKWLTDVAAGFTGECDLPLLVKLPLGLDPELLGAAVAAADALVLATPHCGRLTADGPLGPLYGPGIVPYTLAAVAQAAQSAPDVPIIAAGGIYTEEDAAACALAGAAAVQLDGLLFLDPAGAGRLAASLATGLAGVTASE